MYIHIHIFIHIYVYVYIYIVRRIVLQCVAYVNRVLIYMCTYISCAVYTCICILYLVRCIVLQCVAVRNTPLSESTVKKTDV